MSLQTVINLYFPFQAVRLQSDFQQRPSAASSSKISRKGNISLFFVRITQFQLPAALFDILTGRFNTVRATKTVLG